MFGACVGRKATFNASTADAIQERKQKRIDLMISKRMKANKKQYIHTYRLLLLGSGESGKSTIVKQMQILHKEGFTNDERRRKLSDIHKNVLDSIVAITKAMDTFEPPIILPDHLRPLVNYIWTFSESLDREFTDRFFETTKQLWRDSNVQQSFRRSNEYQLIDCAQYFLDKLDKIKSPTYLPTDQDILRCRCQTTGIHQVKFVMEKVHFHLFDVGGQRYERRRWCQCFHGITAILFVTAMSDFNLTLAEDTKENRLLESVKLFGEVWRNRFLQGVSVILFLNKVDVLTSKLVDAKIKLEDYFFDFKQYNRHSLTPDDKFLHHHFSTNEYSTIFSNVLLQDEPIEVSQAKHFIRDLFVKEKNDQSPVHNGPSLLATSTIRQLYAHYTCAVDTENIRKIFNDVKNTIQIINLKNYELI
ncbi:hypothetical protein GJ496_003564 [Pomphorhynchus laevis]|nr:hypothetical protein GJ496_003564 [Pomphorhynchus laevis]